MDSLNDKQRSAFEAVERGHNIFIGGNAGVGKSFLVTEIFKKLTAAGKQVAITCTTGIACAVYSQTLNPMTVHKWSMIGDGRFTGNQLHTLLMDDDRYSAAKSRIHETEILIVDEISMLSLKMFDMIEYVMRMIKNEKVPFGGTQIVLVGSFLQLPPVRNARYIDCGEFCFKSDYFPHHHIYLTRVIRQSDSELASIINILSIGNILDKYTEDYVQSLDRPLPSSAGTTRLFACNYLVDMYNRDTVLKIQGQLYSFKAIDEGEEKYLQSLVVQKILWMKVGATVMLLRNLSDDLVNGLRGSVVAIREGEVDVHFPTINKLTTLQRMSFTVFDPSRNTNLAVRLQIPLKLAYAMTIHKAQGLTLDRVEIDCRGIFQPGQLAVAVGRVKSVDGLRVVNFTKNAVIQQPKAVLEFQTCSTTPVEEDMSCCLHCCSQENTDEVATEQVVDIASNPDLDIDETVDVLDDDAIDEVVSTIDLQQLVFEIPPAVTLPPEVDVEKQLKSFMFDEPVRLNQVAHNQCIEYLLGNTVKLQEFCLTEYSVLLNIYNETIRPTKKNTVPESQLTAFYKAFQRYITSEQYKQLCLILFTSQHNADAVFSLCFQIVSYLRQVVMKKQTENLPVSPLCQGLSLRSGDKDLTDTARGKIRYVGGYVVAKLYNKYSVQARSCAYKTSSKHIENYEHAKCSLHFLSDMKASELSLLDSEDLGSLEETKRKQNINRGLTNITDDVFLFFLMMVSMILNLMSGVNVSIHGQHTYTHIKDTIRQDRTLLQRFVSLCTQRTQKVSQDIEIETETNEIVNATVQTCLFDIVSTVDVAHTLFDEMLDRTISILIKQFSKDIAIAMKITKKMEHRKQVRVTSKKVKSRQNPTTTSEDPGLPAPSTSQQDSSPVPSTSKQDESDNNCFKCQKAYAENEDWICCDSCNHWFHRKCAGLSSTIKWKKYQKDDVKFVCPLCIRN